MTSSFGVNVAIAASKKTIPSTRQGMNSASMKKKSWWLRFIAI
jgi:hypothetical protein